MQKQQVSRAYPGETVVEAVKPPLRGDYRPGNRSSRLSWSLGDWIRVRTEDGREGWMHITDLVGWAP